MKIDTCKLIIYPKKSLGQNFLVNQGILDKIVGAAEVGPKDTVIEVGPGTGNLTRKLSEKAKRVVAVEKDHRLIEELKEKFKNSNVEIIEEDILKLKAESLKLKVGEYKIVANIPFYITSHFLRTVFEEWPKPKLTVLTVQKEVAQRIMAKPPHMNLLALSVQFYSNPTIIGYISKGSFRPMPKVDSAIISLRPKAESLKPADKDLFFKLVKAGFSEKRKQLLSNLSSTGYKKWALEEIFDKLKISRQARAQELSIPQWIDICHETKFL